MLDIGVKLQLHPDNVFGHGHKPHIDQVSFGL